jgi:integrase
LEQPIAGTVDALRAKPSRHLPTVLTKSEVQAVLKHLPGVEHLVGQRLDGAGLRLHEGLAMRVKDIDFDRYEIVVRGGKGDKDRVTMLLACVEPHLRAHLAIVKVQHQRDLALGHGKVPLPTALDRKYPNASQEWGWQFVFPASTLSRDPHAEDGVLYRWHVYESKIWIEAK